MPGDPKSLTVPGVNESLPSVNRSKFLEKEAFNEHNTKSKSFGMGLQVSRSLDTKMSQEDIVWPDPQAHGRCHKRTGASKGEPGFGRSLVCGSGHVYLAIPPKYAVAQVVGYIKGKSAIHIARAYGGRARNFTGEHFWARGYFVSTVGRDEEVIRNYIRRQEDEDRRLDQLELLR